MRTKSAVHYAKKTGLYPIFKLTVKTHELITEQMGSSVRRIVLAQARIIFNLSENLLLAQGWGIHHS